MKKQQNDNLDEKQVEKELRTSHTLDFLIIVAYVIAFLLHKNVVVSNIAVLAAHFHYKQNHLHWKVPSFCKSSSKSGQRHQFDAECHHPSRVFLVHFQKMIAGSSDEKRRTK